MCRIIHPSSDEMASFSFAILNAYKTFHANIFFSYAYGSRIHLAFCVDYWTYFEILICIKLCIWGLFSPMLGRSSMVFLSFRYCDDDIA